MAILILFTISSILLTEVYNVDPAVVVLFAKLGVLASPNASTFSLGDYVL